jgi:hypothetical protein
MKHVLKHFPQATAEAARSMTYDLRNSAIEHGWHPDIANSLHITHTGSEFKIHVPKKYRSIVHELEYGTEKTPPTAVFRKFNNRPGYMEKAFMKSISRLTGGKL